MHMIEVTQAPSGSKTLISVDLIGEVRDMSVLPSRHLGKFGRTLIRHKSKSVKWIVFDEYEAVKRMIERPGKESDGHGQSEL